MVKGEKEGFMEGVLEEVSFEKFLVFFRQIREEGYLGEECNVSRGVNIYMSGEQIIVQYGQYLREQIG